MKKTVFIIVLFAVYLISVSAHTDKIIDAREGFNAPYFELEQGGERLSLDDMKGRYFLLTFWSSSNAVSRISCKDYARYADEKCLGRGLSHIAVNFDRSEHLFNEIVRRDNLDAEAQYYATGDNAERLKQSYRLEDGFGTYLIDCNGKIVARNPSAEYLDGIFNH